MVIPTHERGKGGRNKNMPPEFLGEHQFDANSVPKKLNVEDLSFATPLFKILSENLVKMIFS